MTGTWEDIAIESRGAVAFTPKSGAKAQRREARKG